MNLIIFLTGFLSGVALRSIISIPYIMLTAYASASVAVFLAVFIYKDKAQKSSMFLVLLLLAFSLGMLRYAAAESEFMYKTRAFSGSEQRMLTGVIYEIPVESEYTVSAKMKTDAGFILIRLEKGSHVAYGDRLHAEVRCEIPQSFETHTGTIFNYQAYLMARHMHHVCKALSYEVIEMHAGSRLREFLYDIRSWFSWNIDRAFGDIHAGLVQGVLLGDKSGLSPELKSTMTIAGVIHIAVLSGSNIAMLAAIVFGFTRMLPYNIRIACTVSIVMLFVLLSGAEPPAVRAGILVALVFLGKFLHRTSHTGRVLLFIAFAMVAWNPFALVYDVSFQLSFLATIGIVSIAPILEKRLTYITEACGIRDVVAGTLGAQCAVTPLLLYTTNALSIVSLPANVLIGWAVPILMIFGFLGGMMYFIWPFLALPIIFVAELLSAYIISVTNISAHMPYAQMLVPIHHPLLLCAMYLCMFIVLKQLQSAPQKPSN